MTCWQDTERGISKETFPHFRFWLSFSFVWPGKTLDSAYLRSWCSKKKNTFRTSLRRLANRMSIYLSKLTNYRYHPLSSFLLFMVSFNFRIAVRAVTLAGHVAATHNKRHRFLSHRNQCCSPIPSQTSTTTAVMKRTTLRTLTPNGTKAGIAGRDPYPYLKDHIGYKTNRITQEKVPVGQLRLIGMEKCIFATSSVALDFPIPDD